MYNNAEDQAIHLLAQAVSLLIQLLQQKQLNEEERAILEKAAKLVDFSIKLVK